MSAEGHPYEEGSFTVIGPECFAAEDGSVLNWRGRNYVPQEKPVSPAEGAKKPLLSHHGIGRLRRLLLIRGSHRWNAIVRDLTARLG